jgi:hypothetical protein
MDEGKNEYTVRRGGKLLCVEFDLEAAFERAYEASEIYPGEPVEVRSRGASQPIFWRVTRG